MITFFTILVTSLALLDQLGRRVEDRDWNGRVLGVPYDFRPANARRLRQRLWNPDDERVVVPQLWGVGWTINLYQLRRRLQLLIA